MVVACPRNVIGVAVEPEVESMVTPSDLSRSETDDAEITAAACVWNELPHHVRLTKSRLVILPVQAIALGVFYLDSLSMAHCEQSINCAV